jgi:F0F1-type ATP synthase gamma subunit
LDQKPTRFEISAQTLLTDVTTGEEKKARDYVFEPHLERILQFFETEIFAGLFEQTVRESQLSKYASRILAMDTAQGNIGEVLAKTSLVELKIEHRDKNSKQLNQLASVAARGY